MATKEHWEMDVWNWDEIHTRVIGRAKESKAETRAQARDIANKIRGESCLEIGAGYGRLLVKMIGQFNYCLGVDSSVSLVALSTLYLKNRPFCRILLMDGQHIPFKNDRYDFVYSFTCFQHITEIKTIRSLISEAHRVLRPGKIFRVQTVIGKRDSGLHDGYVFESLEELFEEFNEFSGVMGAMDNDKTKPWVWIDAKK